jgi:predicted dehydrogenase
VSRAFLEAGIDVICDKPLSAGLKEAEELAALAKKSGLVFAVTLNNTGYAMVRHARELVASGALGNIRIVRAEYIQDWLTLPIDADGQKQAEWRTDPARAGRSACLADIGVHAFSLAHFVSGLAPSEVAADLTTFVPGRRLDDNAHVLMRYASGARGVLVASQVSPGNYNRLSIKVYGDKAGLEWYAHEPEYLHFCEFGKPHVILTRGGAGVGGEAARVSRMPAEHPEGYVEGFGNLYRDAIALISARRRGELMDSSLAGLVPSVEDGLLGMRFIEASVDSNEAGGVWTPIATQL